MTFNVWWIKFTDLKIIRLCSNTIHITRLFIINICCEAHENFVFFALILFKLVLHVSSRHIFFFVVLLNIFLQLVNFKCFLFHSQKADRLWFWCKFIFISSNFRIILLLMVRCWANSDEKYAFYVILSFFMWANSISR
jgi:hypothetical protein